MENPGKLAQPMDDPDLSTLHSGIADYYAQRVRRFGSTPLGVDWSCIASQELRFVQILKVCDFTASLSLNDVGCGYGALVGYLLKRHAEADIDYLGIDLVKSMQNRASQLWREQRWASFTTDSSIPRIADYCVASGVFNVKLQQSTRDWERFVAATLSGMHHASRMGFAVNFMLENSNSSYNNSCEGLYKSKPEKWAGYCEREFGSSVTLIEGYGQPEFTLLVRRQAAHA